MQIKDQITAFTNLNKEAVLAQLHTTEKGLTTVEVKKRIQTNGYNVFSEEHHFTWVHQLLGNLRNPLVLILLLASIISFILHDTVDASIILCIVVLSTLLNFIQEFHASSAAKKLQDRIATNVDVIRDGKDEEIKTKGLVIGDIVKLNAGDLVPADGRIIEAKDFFINQSALTGESFPVEKLADALQTKDTSLTALTNLVFSGSSVTTGTAMMVVIATGKQTELGKIGNKLSREDTDNDFLRGVKNFSALIMRITIFFVLFVFCVNTFLRHIPLFDSFTFAVALAVGLTPELLPMIMSVTMARGSIKMAKKGAIVKKLTAIPSFGSMDVFCTDKTGTLTEAKIELVKYIDVAGNHSDQVLLFAYINSFYQTGIKNPMDEAVIQYKHERINEFKKIDEIPFDFLRKQMSVIVEHEKKHLLITKGAPEEILHTASEYEVNNMKHTLSDTEKQKIIKQYHELSQEGFRVLAIGTKEVAAKKVYEKVDEEKVTLLGFIAFLDPAKKSAKAALAAMIQMGIEIKVISGDNELVTKKICDDVGIPIKGILLGAHMETLTDDALAIKVEQTTIFARFSPEEKNRVILALQKNHHVVGYSGDGINDAPSLKAADVGISVSNAVDVAKEAADIILTHKSLEELKEGILEGRKTFGNTMKYILMGLSSNFGNMFSVLGAIFFLPFLPMLSIQILLNNLLYDLSQISLPTDTVDSEYIQLPKRWNIKFIKKFMYIFGPASSLFDFVTFYILFTVFKLSAHQFQTGWFLESMATQTFVIYVIRTRKIPFLQSVPSKYLFMTTLAVVIVAWILPFTIIGKYFQLLPLSPIILCTIIAIVVIYLFATQILKTWFYKRYNF